MTHNRTFWKAWHSLAHPLSLMAILLLLFNDHWLRYAHPSWLTGKLGDFTWLVFAPFVLAMVLAWIIPQRWKQHTKIVGWLSIGFIGMWFVTAKTIPFIHHLTTQALHAIVGWEGQLRLDITDLLTLPALLISAYIWQKAGDEKVSLKSLAYVAFGLGILGTLASSSMSVYYDRGITCICNYEDLIIIQTRSLKHYYQSFESSDGGYNWKNNLRWNDERLNCSGYSDTLMVSDKNMVLRWTPAEYIEISKDHGSNWEIEYELTPLQQQVRTAYHHYESELIKDRHGPISAYYDPVSGNIIFAMGWNGILVRGEQGDYTWLTLGEYGLENLANVPKAINAIFIELWLALATIFLIATTSTLYIRHSFRSLKARIIIISWIGYAGILILLIADRGDYIYLNGISRTGVASYIMLIFFGIPLSIGAVWDILWNFRSVAVSIALAGIGNGALFIFPFLLWTQGRIPRYVTAYGLSVLLMVCGLYAARIYLKRVLPVLEPEKMKRDQIEKGKKSE